MHNLKPQAGTRSLRLRRKERFEDPGKYIGRDSRAMIRHAYAHPAWITAVAARRFSPCRDLDMPLRRRGVRRVVNQIGPYLAQSRPARLDHRGRSLKLLLYRDLLHTQLVAKDRNGALQTVVHIEVLQWRTVVVREFLHRHGKVGDPRDALFD